jgi:hypothetical protein
LKAAKVVLNPDSPQIQALKKAALEAVPFCEECEKKEETTKKEIVRMYCITEDGEVKTLEKLPIDEEFTLCVETKGMNEREKITIDMEDADGRTYKSGEKIIKLKGAVEVDGTAYIDGVRIEF